MAQATTGTQHRNVTRAAVLTAVGGILFGYDTGVVGGVLPNIAKDFDLQGPFQKGLVVSILPLSYLSIISAIGRTGTFVTYGVVTVLSLVYVIAKVPETKGLKLSEIEAAIAPDDEALSHAA